MSSEIGVNNTLIILQLRRSATGQHLTIGQTINMFSQIHDNPHVMFDYTQSDTKLFIRPPQPVNQAVNQRRVNTSGWLIQKQNFRLIHQRHCKFKQLLLTKG